MLLNLINPEVQKCLNGICIHVAVSIVCNFDCKDYGQAYVCATNIHRKFCTLELMQLWKRKRQKVVNRGALRSCRGGLTLKFDKNSTNYCVSNFNLGGLELCLGGLRPRGDGAGQRSKSVSEKYFEHFADLQSSDCEEVKLSTLGVRSTEISCNRRCSGWGGLPLWLAFLSICKAKSGSEIYRATYFW